MGATLTGGLASLIAAPIIYLLFVAYSISEYLGHGGTFGGFGAGPADVHTTAYHVALTIGASIAILLDLGIGVYAYRRVRRP